MTTKEFIKKIEKMGYTVYEDDFDLTVELGQPNSRIPIMTIYFDDIGGIDTTWDGFDNLLEKDKIELLKLGFDYIITPIADRVEEEKFYWMLKGWGNSYEPSYMFLNVGHNGVWFNVSTKVEKQEKMIRTKFTQIEYNTMVEKGIIADIFEKEEIES